MGQTCTKLSALSSQVNDTCEGQTAVSFKTSGVAGTLLQLTCKLFLKSHAGSTDIYGPLRMSNVHAQDHSLTRST